MRFWGRDKRVAIKGVPDGLKDVFAILTGGGDITANATEAQANASACLAICWASSCLFSIFFMSVNIPTRRLVPA